MSPVSFSCSDIAGPTNLIFSANGEVVGELSWGDGVLKFTGSADESIQPLMEGIGAALPKPSAKALRREVRECEARIRRYVQASISELITETGLRIGGLDIHVGYVTSYTGESCHAQVSDVSLKVSI